jgi:predicted DsbA family dithiol-disulfide isomerase
MDMARELGIAATPAWSFGNSFVVPGVQPRELFERVVSRLRVRTGGAPAGPGR